MDLSQIVALVPEKFLPHLLALWALAFYVVAPLIKKFGSPGTLAVKAAEWISQDTHRPPAVPAGSKPQAVPPAQ